jgi:hypothetical protein
LFTAGVLVHHESSKQDDVDEEDETEAWEMYRQQLVLLPIGKKPAIDLNTLDEESYSTEEDQSDEDDDESEEDDGNSNQSEVDTDEEIEVVVPYCIPTSSSFDPSTSN